MIRPDKFRKCIRLGALTLVGTAAAVALSLAAQPFSFGKIKGLNFQDFFEPPNQSKARALVQGNEAVNEGLSRVRVRQLHIETYQLDGTPEAVIDAPDCVFDYAARTASSAGTIAARTADGRVSLEGTGFLLSLTNKSLIISNNVRTVIRSLDIARQKP